jgi:glycosyltransferase involved in cell wall biosynthesis
VHTHCSKAGILGRFAAKLCGVKTIIHTVHGLAYHPQQSAIAITIYKIVEFIAGLITDRIICVGEVMKQTSLKTRTAWRDRVDVVYSGMEVERFVYSKQERDELRNQLGFSNEHIIIGTATRIAPRKGMEFLLETFYQLLQQHPYVRLLIVGDGILRKKIEDEIAQKGMSDKVVITGMVNPQQVPKYLNAMDIVIHASVWEGLPRFVVQAVLCQKPVVAFDTDGTKEIIIDGKTGFLIPQKSLQRLINAIDKLVVDKNLRENFGTRGTENFRRQFDHRKMVEDIDKIYHKFI